MIPLGRYRHYKGNLYEVVGFAAHSETLEDMVIYKPLYSEGKTWVRPLSMWEELVDVGGKAVKRFEYAGRFEWRQELAEAHRALLSTLSKCEKIAPEKLSASQRTLLERRIAALKVALSLINEKLGGEHEADR